MQPSLFWTNVFSVFIDMIEPDCVGRTCLPHYPPSVFTVLACMIVVTLQLGPCQPGQEYSPLSWYLCMWGLKLTRLTSMLSQPITARLTLQGEQRFMGLYTLDVSLALVCYVFGVMSGLMLVQWSSAASERVFFYSKFLIFIPAGIIS